MASSSPVMALSPLELKELMKDKDRCLLIDARPYSEFLLSHIVESVSVRLSSLMTRRLAKGTNSLYDLVIQEQKEKYQQVYDNEGSRVIVYDKDTAAKVAEADGKTPLHVILKALKKTGKRCHYIDGGFEAVESTIPELVNVPVFEGTVPFPSLQVFDRSLMDPNGHLPPIMTPVECQQSPSYNVQSLVASEVTPQLFIGSRKDASNKELLRSLGINTIVNATKDCPHHFETDSSFNYFRVPVKDTWNQDLPSYFPGCFQFIDSMKNEGNKILIHCTAGISRSATLTIAYIMFSEKECLSNAYTYVKNKRPAISPNLDFMGELQQYEKTLGLSEATQSTPQPMLTPDAVQGPPPSFTLPPQSTTNATPTIKTI